MTAKPLRIAVVAGEPSGDVLAAGMIRELKRRHPDAIIEGIGGDNMQAAGCHSLFDMETLSVMGLVEVLSRLPQIFALKKKLIRHLLDNRPDVYIGVDAPDFNLRVEKSLKAHGIKTVHYVSPTVWAWREKRIHKIAAATNLVLGLFPFEQQVYDKYQVPYRFVGHTLAEAVPLEPNRTEARQKLDLPQDEPILAVLPGSRQGELNRLLPVFVETIKTMKATMPKCLFVIPAANQKRLESIQSYIKDNAQEFVNDNSVIVTLGGARDVMIASDVVLLASGTATLEAMLCKRPMVAAYKMSALTYKMMQRLYKAKFFALPNLLSDKLLIPELLQEDVNPENLASHILPMFESDNKDMVDTFYAIHKSLMRGADKQSADAVLELIDG